MSREVHLTATTFDSLKRLTDRRSQVEVIGILDALASGNEFTRQRLYVGLTGFDSIHRSNLQYQVVCNSEYEAMTIMVYAVVDHVRVPDFQPAELAQRVISDRWVSDLRGSSGKRSVPDQQLGNVDGKSARMPSLLEMANSDERMLPTLHVLADDAVLAQILGSTDDVEAGNVVGLEPAKLMLGFT